MRQQQLRLQDGFTIIELMIATVVLSVILLLVTTMMTSIGNLYYKGINQARIQNNVRSLTDEITQHLQLSDNGAHRLESPDHLTVVYCIGDTRYVFKVGQQLSSTHHALWRDTKDCIAPDQTFLDAPTGGVELIAPKSRLTSFCISGSVPNSCIPDRSPYTLSIGVAYGDDDLLCDDGDATHPSDCGSATASSRIWNGSPPFGKVQCKGGAGGQFCATAGLSTSVVQRL